VVAEYIRGKIHEIVDDPETAEALCPTDHPFATKRPCLDTGYYATFNLPHVRLVDIRKHPIDTVTEAGIDTADESFEFDAIVYATGFDAMTGALVSVDIRGRDGLTLEQKWADGPVTYLGLGAVGFPNLFMVTGPGSPSVLSNMMVSIEQHVDWITDALVRNRAEGVEVMEPTPTAEAGWVQHVNDYADITLYPTANSWYMGANVPGKPRVFLPYVGGVDRYRQICTDVAEQDYLGFRLLAGDDERCNDGVICRVQPDVTIMLETMAELGAPAIEDLSVEDARAFMAISAAGSPPGPEVGEVVDGVLPGSDGSDRRYRLYRPSTPGPHPVTAYFHGGGWVLGSHESDDPFCRDLCVRSDTVVISVDYRHAPEDRFPAAAEDGFAALQWIADHAIELGGIPGQLAVCGWSAGGNVAAVAAQMARDAGAPQVSAQVLINPVTDSDLSRPSYQENGEGFMLTRRLMEWFWDHYADAGDRSDPRAAPIRGDLHGLPPALVVTCELDPLRDEGRAYAEGLQAAGVPVRYLSGRGQMHTSIPYVDVIATANDLRDEIGRELGRMVRERVGAIA
jgi:acetyl esterase/lipase